MAMEAADIERLIKESLPEPEVSIEDLRGAGDHYAGRVAVPPYARRSRRERGGAAAEQEEHAERTPSLSLLAPNVRQRERRKPL